ncbi:hypothetical protein AAFF_G00424710 [Aldrovandia affinis]|uniref:Uncharacterized protein n=1 Tax=Aldrovandia affinis TaxID=143900 RepID=A0AAD7T8E3_9TELE|nr:hypothetical protein AAFF_G00424710 [Aldrovandia affinis]
MLSYPTKECQGHARDRFKTLIFEPLAYFTGATDLPKELQREPESGENGIARSQTTDPGEMPIGLDRLVMHSACPATTPGCWGLRPATPGLLPATHRWEQSLDHGNLRRHPSL